ncbi:hypothetical protein FRC0505_02449 [Corynebacterium diphtheriae]|nr:hypothetical protein CIP107505_01872 [Corynebacterium diphtheriae]CAB0522169.1 hypothetical protein CIP107502_01920 [Corynebacterium diphtheriae]CAB0568099.1 hypothetical protein CIP107510_01995 [Corynebacterium diphtheriae]CAB0777615.1 hypothetical protein FRC0151_01962 [Corynebacterium diphtheriae]CAB0867514.1 hypothetical protein FRC0314_02400 [Corynebacterium diphtheriae]
MGGIIFVNVPVATESVVAHTSEKLAGMIAVVYLHPPVAEMLDLLTKREKLLPIEFTSGTSRYRLLPALPLATSRPHGQHPLVV